MNQYKLVFIYSLISVTSMLFQFPLLISLTVILAAIVGWYITNLLIPKMS
jgi:hypothetical protein